MSAEFHGLWGRVPAIRGSISHASPHSDAATLSDHAISPGSTQNLYRTHRSLAPRCDGPVQRPCRGDHQRHDDEDSEGAADHGGGALSGIGTTRLLRERQSEGQDGSEACEEQPRPSARSRGIGHAGLPVRWTALHRPLSIRSADDLTRSPVAVETWRHVIEWWISHGSRRRNGGKPTTRHVDETAWGEFGPHASCRPPWVIVATCLVSAARWTAFGP